MVLHKKNVALSIIIYISQRYNATVFPIKQFKEPSSKNIADPAQVYLKNNLGGINCPILANLLPH